MSTIRPEVLQELVNEEQNLHARAKDMEQMQEICERYRNRVAAFKYLLEVLRANPVEPTEVESHLE